MRKVRLGITVGVALLVQGGGLAAYFVWGLIRSSAVETHHRELLVTLQGLDAGVVDLSVSRRGFVLTAEERHLEAYDRRKRELAIQLGELRRLAAGDVLQAGRLRDIEPLIANRIAELDASIALKRAEPENFAAQAERTNSGLANTEAIRGLIGAMVVHEQNLLAAWDRAFEHNAWGVILIVGAVDLVALAFVLVAGVTIHREMREKQQAQDSLQEANERLEQAVVERTEELVRINDSLREEVRQRIEADEELRRHALQLETLSARVVAVQESERARLARELHDEIGQVLTAIKLNLQAISVADGQRAQTLLLESIHLVDDAVEQVRDFSLTLRPALLDDLGLVPAIRWLVDREAQRAGLKYQVSVWPENLRVDPELATTCFRIVQESLTNVVRHAKAASVRVELRREADDLKLSIADDGTGFAVPTQAQWGSATGKGLLGMRERLALIGGHIEITSSPQWGTRVDVRFPYSGVSAPVPALQGTAIHESNSYSGG